MELEELALLTSEEIEQEIQRIYPDPIGDGHYADEYDQVREKRIELHRTILRIQIEAFLDGKHPMENFVTQLRYPRPKSLLTEREDCIRRKLLLRALSDLKYGEKTRNEIIEDLFYQFNLF